MFENQISTNTANSPIPKILLAEDDNSVRRFIEVILKRANYEVLSAEDGLSAMKLAMENDIQAVISDAVMPNLSGYDLCRVLRQNPSYQDTPFILLSGFENEAENNQANAYLPKENNLKENLLATLANLLTQNDLLIHQTS